MNEAGRKLDHRDGACLGSEAGACGTGRLNAAYTALRPQPKTAGSAMPCGPAQRAWIAFRDLSCAYERTTWGGVTGAGPAVAQVSDANDPHARRWRLRRAGGGAMMRMALALSGVVASGAATAQDIAPLPISPPALRSPSRISRWNSPARAWRHARGFRAGDPRPGAFLRHAGDRRLRPGGGAAILPAAAGRPQLGLRDRVLVSLPAPDGIDPRRSCGALPDALGRGAWNLGGRRLRRRRRPVAAWCVTPRGAAEADRGGALWQSRADRRGGPGAELGWVGEAMPFARCATPT